MGPENILAAVLGGISSPIILLIGGWLGKKLNNVNAHLARINGRLDANDKDWQDQREQAAWFAAKIGEPLPKPRHRTEEGC